MELAQSVINNEKRSDQSVQCVYNVRSTLTLLEEKKYKCSHFRMFIRYKIYVQSDILWYDLFAPPSRQICWRVAFYNCTSFIHISRHRWKHFFSIWYECCLSCFNSFSDRFSIDSFFLFCFSLFYSIKCGTYDLMYVCVYIFLFFFLVYFLLCFSFCVIFHMCVDVWCSLFDINKRQLHIFPCKCIDCVHEVVNMHFKEWHLLWIKCSVFFFSKAIFLISICIQCMRVVFFFLHHADTIASDSTRSNAWKINWDF